MALQDAIAHVRDDCTILVGGQTNLGIPRALLRALSQSNVRGIRLVTNAPGYAKDDEFARLFEQGQVREVVCSFSRLSGGAAFTEALLAGTISVEVVPMGTLTERIRAGGAGIAGFYTRTGVGTPLENGRASKVFDGRKYLLEEAIHADVALIYASSADRYGNLHYRGAARNYNPTMATAAEFTIAEVGAVRDYTIADGESTGTPGIFVDAVVSSADGANCDQY